jgi:hypothetical protein
VSCLVSFDFLFCDESNKNDLCLLDKSRRLLPELSQICKKNSAKKCNLARDTVQFHRCITSLLHQIWARGVIDMGTSSTKKSGIGAGTGTGIPAGTGNSPSPLQT